MTAITLRLMSRCFFLGKAGVAWKTWMAIRATSPFNLEKKMGVRHLHSSPLSLRVQRWRIWVLHPHSTELRRPGVV